MAQCISPFTRRDRRNVVAYNAVLKLADFADHDFREELAAIFTHHAKTQPNFPAGHEQAKAWEITQAIRGLRDHGALRPDAQILGVAAGQEHTIFYLTNHVDRVFATDLYGTNEIWDEASYGMLVDPKQFVTPGTKWNPRRLVVQHMDALRLNYEDDSFDGLFSCGSIEHFGSLANVARSMREMRRVLKPGGIATVATEYRIAGPRGIGLPGIILFDRLMVMTDIIKASGLTPVDAIDFEVTEETVACAYPLSEAVMQGRRDRSIAVTDNGYKWTSIALCLRKD